MFASTLHEAFPSNKTDNLSQYILDPLSVIVKLAILNNKPIGTKLLIVSNGLFFQEPGMFQSFCRRFLAPANKTDLTYINNPLHLACRHFLSESYTSEHEMMPALFTEAHKGLLRLCETYKTHDIIRIALHHYATVISSYLYISQGNPTPNFISDAMTPLYTQSIVETMNKQWSAPELRNILNVIKYLTSTEPCNAIQDVAGLETFMVRADQKTHSLIAGAHT